MPLHSSLNLNTRRMLCKFMFLYFYRHYSHVRRGRRRWDFVIHAQRAHISSNMTANTFCLLRLNPVHFLYLVVGYSSCTINGKNAKSSQHFSRFSISSCDIYLELSLHEIESLLSCAFDVSIIRRLRCSDCDLPMFQTCRQCLFCCFSRHVSLLSRYFLVVSSLRRKNIQTRS